MSLPPYERFDERNNSVFSRSRPRRLLLAAVVLFVLFIAYWNSASNDWTAEGVGNGFYRLLPSIVDFNFTMEDVEEAVKISIFPAVEESIRFRRRPETSHVDCQRAIAGDKSYMRTIASARPVVNSTSIPPMDCFSLRSRILPPRPLRPTNFGVAFVRIVYTNYEFIEDEIRSSFHPENLFCFIADQKADKRFKSQMRQLSKCFPNIFIVQKEFDIDGAGHNMNFAHLECLRLLNRKPHWEYALLLQNHDVIIRTPYELVEAYKAMGGANDVELTPCPGDRWDQSLKWDAKTLGLFKNETKIPKERLSASLRMSKGAVQASLSRAAVTWMLETVNITEIVDRLNKMPFGVDEVLVQSLQITDEWDMPGRFTHQCLDKGHLTDFVSRMSHWEGDPRRCASGTLRHAICVLGLEDLPSISKYPNLMVNKFMPDFDYAGLDCLHELIFNRTHLGQPNPFFDLSYYTEMVNVRYHKKRKSLGGKEPPLECVPRRTWGQMPYP